MIYVLILILFVLVHLFAVYVILLLISIWSLVTLSYNIRSLNSISKNFMIFLLNSSLLEFLIISSGFISSIRAMCGLDSEKNCVHGSDSTQSAEREISFFFKEASAGQFPFSFSVKQKRHICSFMLKLMFFLGIMSSSSNDISCPCKSRWRVRVHYPLALCLTYQ